MKREIEVILKDYELKMDFQNNKEVCKKKYNFVSQSPYIVKRRLMYKKIFFILALVGLLISVSFISIKITYEVGNKNGSINNNDYVSEALSIHVIKTVPIPFYSQVINEDIIIYYYIGLNRDNDNILIANISTKKDHINVTFSYENEHLEISLDEYLEDNSRWFAMKINTKEILELNVHVIDNTNLSITKVMNINIGECLEYLSKKNK